MWLTNTEGELELPRTACCLVLCLASRPTMPDLLWHLLRLTSRDPDARRAREDSLQVLRDTAQSLPGRTPDHAGLRPYEYRSDSELHLQQIEVSMR